MNEDKHEKAISIAFVIPHLEIGGVGKSLLSLLDVLHRKDNISVHILFFQKTGELLAQVPSWVQVEQIEEMERHEKIRSLTASILRVKGLRLFFNFAKKIYHRIGYQNKTKKSMKYDIAVGYQDGAPTWYVAKNIVADKKAAFIHTDFYKAKYDHKLERKVYRQFDQIYCVSKGAKESFVRLLPEFEEKTQVFPNIIDSKRIQALSIDSKAFQDDFTGLRLLTVGRLSHEKGLDKAVRVLKRLLNDGYKVRWYVIGQGNEKNNLVKLAKNLNVQQEFILLGSMENPYGFIANCDIYVQPSNYEGYSITVAEARALYRPIVACDFAGAREQLTSGVNGLICGFKDEELYASLKMIISDQGMRSLFTLNLKQQAETLFGVEQSMLEDFIKIH